MGDIYFLIIGIILILIGCIILFCIGKKVFSCNITIMAKVEKVEKRKVSFWKGKRLYQYFPTVSYIIEEKEYKTKSDFPIRESKNYNSGDVIAIRVSSKKPNCAYIKLRAFPIIGGIVTVVLGIILVICYFL